MATDFADYMTSYGKSGDGDGDDSEDLTLLQLNTECSYYDIEEMSKFVRPNSGYKYTAIHLNIHSLPSKHAQLRTNMFANLQAL